MHPLLLRSVRRFLHYLAYAASGAVIIVCIAALLFKFWLMPNISHYGKDLNEAASRALGQPVEIGRLHADWSGFNPRVTLRDIRMTPPAGPPLLLPRVEAIFSWLSLPLLELRLASLNIEQASLFMRRDTAGVITLAGIAINQPGPTSPLPDWLLGQPRIVVKNAEITWLDEKLNAPALKLSNVRFLLENRFGRHRFGGVATPTAAAAHRFEVRGDLYGRSLQDKSDWSGDLYARVDGAQFESWGRWVPWAQKSVRSGIGDMRFWLKLNKDQTLDLRGDVRLSKVAINIDPKLPDLMFDSLTGRAGWARKQTAHSFFVDQLRFKTPDAAPSEPASLRVDLTPNEGVAPPESAETRPFKRIDVKARNLQLEALTALTNALPLPQRAHDLIQALNPRGRIEEGDGHWTGQQDYALKLRIRAAGFNAHAQFPGLTGLTARIDASQDGGEAVIDGRGLTLALPQIFWHELNFNQLDAQANWKLDSAGMKLNFAADRIVNADLDGQLNGELIFPKTGPILADISAHLSRGEAKAVYRYLPKVVGTDTYDWLKHGLQAGRSDAVSLVLKGPLQQFPFDRGGGEFKVAVNIQDGVLDYAPGWPRIESAQGVLVFAGSKMQLDAQSGRILATQLGPVKVTIPDLHAAHGTTLHIDGQAFGATNGFLSFIKASPVHEYTGGFIDDFSAQGDGRLNLRLTLPLHALDTSTVLGQFAFQNNRLNPGRTMPELSQVSGTLNFSETSLQAENIRALLLNLPVNLDIASITEPGTDKRQIRLHLDGEVGAAALKSYLPANLAKRLSGSTRWQADVGMRPAASKSATAPEQQPAGLIIQSDLVGLDIDLPAPFGKKAAHALPLSIVQESSPHNAAAPQTESQLWFARYGELLTLRANLPNNTTGATTNTTPKIHVRLGAGEASAPQESGLTISGTLRKLDLDAWRQIDLGGTNQAAALPFREANVTFNEIRLLNRRLNDTHLKLLPAGNGWRIALVGREITGEITTATALSGTNVSAHFKRLIWPDAVAVAPASRETPKTALPSLATTDKRILGIDLRADSVAWQGRELGEMNLRLTADALGLRLDNLLLAHADGRLRAKGNIANHPRRPTQLELQLESDKLGQLLDRLGLPGHVKRGSVRIAGPLGWMGTLENFEIARLHGQLDINLKNGQFTQIEPGAGKLLGILSLQALPRRIALDFRDIFSEGFAFDEIIGKVHLERGSAYTKNLRMSGPAAKVSMSGVADLVHESQNLRVHIEPRLEDTLAVAGALLGGPVVGVGALIAGKVLQNPIGQAASFEYAITGPWAEPLISKIAKPKIQPPTE